MASSWERLASVTLGSAADTINSGTITAKTHLKFTFELLKVLIDEIFFKLAGIITSILGIKEQNPFCSIPL